MDLDNLKKTWQATEVRPTIDECKIQKMLDNRGQSAFEKLIKYDRIFLWLLIPCIFAGVLFYYIHPVPGIIYCIVLINGFCWQTYKLRFMKKVNLSEMGILEVSRCITKYRKLLLYEIIIGSVGIVVFFVPYIYFGIPGMLSKISGRNSEQVQATFDICHMAVMLIITIVSAAVLSFFLYKYMYFDNIKQVQNSIKEIEEFEKENN
jgi:hypothetical protein